MLVYIPVIHTSKKGSLLFFSSLNRKIKLVRISTLVDFKLRKTDGKNTGPLSHETCPCRYRLSHFNISSKIMNPLLSFIGL